MSDRREQLEHQFRREARIGVAAIVLALSVFACVAYLRVSGSLDPIDEQSPARQRSRNPSGHSATPVAQFEIDPFHPKTSTSGDQQIVERLPTRKLDAPSISERLHDESPRPSPTPNPEQPPSVAGSFAVGRAVSARQMPAKDGRPTLSAPTTPPSNDGSQFLIQPPTDRLTEIRNQQSAHQLNPSTSTLPIRHEIATDIQQTTWAPPAQDEIHAAQIAVTPESSPSEPVANELRSSVSADHLREIVDSNSYRTCEGDTLFRIAAEQLGQASRYTELIQLNRSVLPTDVRASSPLQADVTLRLPTNSPWKCDSFQ